MDGPIPEELGNLYSLKTLNLGDNQLTGTIPEELGNLNRLDFLYLDNNQLSGPIPAELGSLTGLRVTRFAGNTDADDNPVVDRVRASRVALSHERPVCHDARPRSHR